MDSKLQKLLKVANSKKTRGRISILETLIETKSPISIEDLEQKLKNKKINQSTIYRALNNFVEKGIVKQVDFRDKKAYFEISDENHHHHIICTKCKKTEDVLDCEIFDIENKLLKKSKFFDLIKNHSLEFFGICKKCSK